MEWNECVYLCLTFTVRRLMMSTGSVLVERGCPVKWYRMRVLGESFCWNSILQRNYILFRVWKLSYIIIVQKYLIFRVKMKQPFSKQKWFARSRCTRYQQWWGGWRGGYHVIELVDILRKEPIQHSAQWIYTFPAICIQFIQYLFNFSKLYV